MKRGLGLIVCGPPGVGKTTFSLQFPKPLTCISLYETGFDDFQIMGEVPDGCQNFNIYEYAQLTQLIQQPCRTLVLDSLSGFQQVYFDYLIKQLYNGESKKFTAYYTGPRQDAPNNLLPFLNILNTLLQKGTNVVLIGHQRTVEISNPLGEDYIKAEVDIDEGIRNAFYKWAPNILYMSLDSTISKGTADSSSTRLIYTTTSLQHCAKNKLNLPKYIPMGDNPRQAFTNFWDKIPAQYKA